MEINKDVMNSKDIFPEERLDALADVLAEGFLYLAEHGLLDSDMKESCSDLIALSEEGKCSNGPKRP